MPKEYFNCQFCGKKEQIPIDGYTICSKCRESLYENEYNVVWKSNGLIDECVLDFGFYENNRLAIRLLYQDNRELCTVATVNLPGIELVDPRHVFIKNWSENEGVLDALVEAGIIEIVGGEESPVTVPTGYVKANVCKLKII